MNTETKTELDGLKELKAKNEAILRGLPKNIDEHSAAYAVDIQASIKGLNRAIMQIENPHQVPEYRRCASCRKACFGIEGALCPECL